MKPLLVGESNPYGADPYFALYPRPVGSAGWRLCHKILGMGEREYLRTFERCNLLSLVPTQSWGVRAARAAASRLRHPRRILLGSRVAAAHGVIRPDLFQEYPYGQEGLVLILPHPSGRCLLWNDPANIAAARLAVEAFVMGCERIDFLKEG